MDATPCNTKPIARALNNLHFVREETCARRYGGEVDG